MFTGYAIIRQVDAWVESFGLMVEVVGQKGKRIAVQDSDLLTSPLQRRYLRAEQDGLLVVRKRQWEDEA